ncbi:hypothetical protein RC94_07525 [Pectobacterium brasiliense]|uniref:NYN domain-containing protein n=1 Tax=Pectobacterium brasiliense TaxID=180957 RepID=UPI00057D30A2|nr:NYN domain-containing protein [Pectobacterium brasiliense]KHS75130.1 hypothetical protein RC79_00530 [Pectobacterium brasiliense]KHT08666.1 hypothetical protein RC92_00520 [Pectobacterium brasiliense]KHT10715.1 hypothetical protein RC94_07525 [Pectobacterium brasiliense]
MKDLESAKKIAVLIDAENAQSSVMGAVLAELTKHGHIIVKRAYGDWSSSHLKNWKQPLNELAITPFQQFSYTQGKNSSDAAMIIDAMDLLYSNKFDAFALISSDSDFTKLASRLKESQIYVFGVGEKKTPVAFRNSCDDFIFIEVLKNLSIDPDENKDEGKSENTDPIKKSKKELRSDTHLMRILKNSINEYTEEDGWAPLASCGSLIKRQHPDFDARNYGYSSLTKLIESIELFDIDRRKSNKEIVSHDVVYIKNKRS